VEWTGSLLPDRVEDKFRRDKGGQDAKSERDYDERGGECKEG